MGGIANSILSARAISKSFRESTGDQLSVLDELSFSLPPNKIVGILGASGCGKTTLLRIVAGLDKPTGGEVVSSLKRPGAKIGFLQQGERLLPWRNVTGNVALGLELEGFTKQEAQRSAIAMLQTVGMEEFQKHFPSQLSGGMTQRVLLARTLITRPSLLLLDEPLGQLDIIGRKALASIIRKYIDDHNASALLVTHSVEEAVFIADYIFTLSRRPSRIVSRYSLSSDCPADFERIDRATSFDTVLKSLLVALDAKGDI